MQFIDLVQWGAAVVATAAAVRYSHGALSVGKGAGPQGRYWYGTTRIDWRTPNFLTRNALLGSLLVGGSALLVSELLGPLLGGAVLLLGLASMIDLPKEIRLRFAHVDAAPLAPVPANDARNRSRGVDRKPTELVSRVYSGRVAGDKSFAESDIHLLS